MQKRKISAREAVADFRSGMNDSDLMAKYCLRPEGLQSLLDKLVHAGYLDLSEVQARKPGFMGILTVDKAAPDTATVPQSVTTARKPDKSVVRVNAQEVARQIRLGMSDSDLMLKYGISPKSLDELFCKLRDSGLVTQGDLDRRCFIMDHTVDLQEDALAFSGVLAAWRTVPPRAGSSQTKDQSEKSAQPGIPEKSSVRQAAVPPKGPIVRSGMESNGKAGEDTPGSGTSRLLLLVAGLAAAGAVTFYLLWFRGAGF